MRYAVTGPLRDVVVCHCSRCRRTHGHFAAYSACERGDLVLVEAAGLRWYEDDGGRERGFCATCGASLFWRRPGGAKVSITAGSLDEPTGLTTIAQIYTRDRGDYYAIDGPGERFEGGRPPPEG